MSFLEFRDIFQKICSTEQLRAAGLLNILKNQRCSMKKDVLKNFAKFTKKKQLRILQNV